MRTVFRLWHFLEIPTRHSIDACAVHGTCKNIYLMQVNVRAGRLMYGCLSVFG
jgi:hypothetical protein